MKFTRYAQGPIFRGFLLVTSAAVAMFMATESVSADDSASAPTAQPCDNSDPSDGAKPKGACPHDTLNTPCASPSQKEGGHSVDSGLVNVRVPTADSQGMRPDQLLFVLLVVSTLATWRLYRNERNHRGRTRIAATTALLSLLFLSAAPALPWYQIVDIHQIPVVTCGLGDETNCAAIAVTLGGSDGYETSRSAAIAQWLTVSASTQLGHMLMIMFLLPLLLWLAVAPSLRTAQATIGIATSVSTYTLIAALFYRFCAPPWIEAQMFWSSDLVIVACANVLVACFVIFRDALALSETKPSLARAVLIRH